MVSRAAAPMPVALNSRSSSKEPLSCGIANPLEFGVDPDGTANRSKYLPVNRVVKAHTSMV